MAAKTKEFIEFWMENSVHPRLDLGLEGSTQNASDLAERLLRAALDQGLSADDIAREIGDPTNYIKARLDILNAAEFERRRR